MECLLHKIYIFLNQLWVLVGNTFLGIIIYTSKTLNMNIIRHALDHEGQPVFIGTYLLDKDNNFVHSFPLYLRIAKTIENPTVVIDILVTCHKRYYYRTINWERTLLVCVKTSNGLRRVDQYFEEPSGKFMAQLYRNAKFAFLL